MNAEDPEIDITAIKYTNDFENGNPVTIVSSGKDDATAYNYNFYDDDDDNCDEQSCIPVNWYAVDFDDSNWNSSAAPFGNDELDGVSPGTIWDTEDGGLKDYLIIRHHFTYSDEYEAISSTLNLAHNNYYIAYLNGNLIRDCSYYQNHDDCYEGDAAYWDNVLTYDGSSDSGPNPDWLVNGDNVLAILAIDITYGQDTDQWIDVELVVNVQAWKENPLVLGDNLVLGIDFFNNEENNVTDLNVTLEIEGTEFANLTIDIETNKTFQWTVEWTPNRLGEINVTANVLNESLTRFIHVGYYAYNFSVNNSYLVGNTSEILTYDINISNIGSVDDNYTFQLYGASNDWDIEFVPVMTNLAPGETGAVRLEIRVDNDTFAGIYELTLTARSQYYGEVTNTVVQSGRDNRTEWKWVNSTGDRLYESDDTTWTEIDFEPDSNWTLEAAPFGDSDLGSIDYNTEWTGNNYAYFRHIFYIENLSVYENNTLSLNMAANNYGTYYLNGEEIFNDMGWGQGHTARYWNEEIKINTSLLKEGKNVLASVVRETGNTQWFDEELVSIIPKSSIWGFQPEYLSIKLEVLPVYDFEFFVPIEEKAVEEVNYTFEIKIVNKGNIGDSYEIDISLNDTRNFSIINYTSLAHVEFGEDGIIYLNISLNQNTIDEFSIGEFNVSVTSMNSTEKINLATIVKARLFIETDTIAPATYVKVSRTNTSFAWGALVNNSSFNLQWDAEEWYKENEIKGNDTRYFLIEVSDDNGTNRNVWTNWTVWGNFSAQQPNIAAFTGGKDNYAYRFRSVGVDDDGLVEDKEEKYDSEVLVDLSAPYAIVELRTTVNITQSSYIEINWTCTHPNVTGYNSQYRVNEGNWTIIESSSLAKWIGFNAPIDGEYEFRVITTDKAQNQGISETSRKITVDTSAPETQIRKLDEFTSDTEIEIHLDNLEDSVNFTLYYYVPKEGKEDLSEPWVIYGSYNISELPIVVPVITTYHYYFKISVYDLAGNFQNNDRYEHIIVDHDPPSSVRELLVAKGNTITNKTIDVFITFKQPIKTSLPNDIVGYNIYRSTSKNETGILISTLNYGETILSHKDAKVEIGTKYYYSVMAVDRIGFESDAQTSSLNLSVEEEINVLNNDGVEEIDITKYIGGGLLFTLAAGGAGYYFIGRGVKDEIESIVAEVVEEKTINFTEINDEFLCNACGAMFPITDGKSCPSCGLLED